MIPAIDGWFEHVKPLTERQKQIIAENVAATNEADVKKLLGVQHWVRDLSYRDALERLASQPTVNIEGMYAGYTGPGGKTILPSKATAKLDFRLVPDQTAAEAEAKLKAHLAKRGYGDIEVKVTGGYDPTQTDENSSPDQGVDRRSTSMKACRSACRRVSRDRGRATCSPARR